jgi:hypothetical protein
VTLSTDIYALDKVDPHEVFRFCQGLLTKYDERPGTSEQISDDYQDRSYVGVPGIENFVAKPENPWTIANGVGQGLPAWLLLHYRPGAPLRVTTDECTEDCDSEPDEDGYQYHYHPEACWLRVNFDTTYSYKDSAGRGCGDLHALLVAELGEWLTARGVRWKWRNEFTGEVHEGAEKLIDLCTSGFAAQAWFTTSVLPVIMGGKLEDTA